MKNQFKVPPLFLLIMVVSVTVFAQDKSPYVRIARIQVDSSQLNNYRAALKEAVETAVRVEPGVLELKAMYDKEDPAAITVFEVYASVDAYKKHLETPHFKKYKSTTSPMVKSLELHDVIPIAMPKKK